MKATVGVNAPLTEAAWTTAGKLALIIHLENVRDGFTSIGQLHHDHDLLEGYGYDMAPCRCFYKEPVVSVVLWDS